MVLHYPYDDFDGRYRPSLDFTPASVASYRTFAVYNGKYRKISTATQHGNALSLRKSNKGCLRISVVGSSRPITVADRTWKSTGDVGGARPEEDDRSLFR